MVLCPRFYVFVTTSYSINLTLFSGGSTPLSVCYFIINECTSTLYFLAGSTTDDSSDDSVTITVGNYYNLPTKFEAYFGFNAGANDTNFYIVNQIAPVMYWASIPNTNSSYVAAQTLSLYPVFDVVCVCMDLFI